MTLASIGSAAPSTTLKNDFLAAFLKNRNIAGAVTLVAHEGKTVHLAATGFADLKSRRLMQPDDLFWVASLTKPITSAAILVLADEGRLSLHDPLGKWLPEFRHPWLIEEKTDDRLVWRRPQGAITLRDLLRHTHGLPDAPQPDAEASLAEWVRATAREPLKFEPGTRWEYGNVGMNALGRVVEVVTKEPFTLFVQQRFFEPLGMKETSFFPTDAQVRRLAALYTPSETGAPLEKSSIPLLPGEITSSRRTVFPGGGLFSTACDMLRFYQMLANGGTDNGRRYLSKNAIAEMTTTQTGDIKAGFGDGMSYGLGLNIVREPTGYTKMLAPGSYGHDGASGTSAWIDPQRKLVMILMMQGTKLHRLEIGLRVRAAFQEAAEHNFGIPRSQ